jgi:hypothetical protein
MAGARFSDELPSTTLFLISTHADIGTTTLMLFKALIQILGVLFAGILVLVSFSAPRPHWSITLLIEISYIVHYDGLIR